MGQIKEMPSLVRRIVIIIDYSAHAAKQTYFPNYLDYLRLHVPRLVRHVNRKHTLSYTGLVITHDSTATIACPLVFSPDDFQDAFLNVSVTPSGEQSIAQSIHKAMKLLPNSSKSLEKNEILYFTASLVTIDTDSVQREVDRLKEAKIRCSVISFCGQLQIFLQLAKVSNGVHYVPLDGAHFKRVLLEFLNSDTKNTEKSTETDNGFISFGFPIICPAVDSKSYRFCICHLRVPKYGYECPRCHAWLCGTLPKTCDICSFLIVPSTFVYRAQLESQKRNMPQNPRKEETVSLNGSVCIEKSDVFCAICDFPLCEKPNSRGEIRVFHSCVACGARRCTTCTNYIDNFILVSPCCGSSLSQ